jgi:hypothetical protein
MPFVGIGFSMALLMLVLVLACACLLHTLISRSNKYSWFCSVLASSCTILYRLQVLTNVRALGYTRGARQMVDVAIGSCTSSRVPFCYNQQDQPTNQQDQPISQPTNQSRISLERVSTVAAY